MPKVTDDDIDLAKRVSPEAFLRRNYADVHADRRGRSVGVNDILRADLRNHHWVACDWHGGGIGDNLALARWVKPSMSFVEAVRELAGGTGPLDIRPSATPAHDRTLDRPRVPRRSGEDEGRAYLEARGISPEVIRMAEGDGMLNYCQVGVVFQGRDTNVPGHEVRLAGIRYFERRVMPNGKMGNKRDLAGSDKAFPVTYSGDRAKVALVEGGVNGLAVLDMAFKRGDALPCVIVTGGVGIRSWLQSNDTLAAWVAAADEVELWAENEIDAHGDPNPVKQAKTDILRELLAADVAELRFGELPTLVYPMPGCKDAADENALAEAPAFRM